MSSATHTEIVKARAKKIGNLNTDAISKLDNDIFNLAASRMNSKLGSQAYGSYVNMFTDNRYDSTKAFHELTDGEKKLRSLETAESYYVLYFLALALKEINKGAVISSSITFGEGAIKPAPIMQFIDMREQYLFEGDKLVQSYSATGGVRFYDI